VAGKDPIISGVAGRYASALFELALENKAVDSVKKDLDQFDSLVAESADLNRLVRSPAFGADDQLNALSAVLAKADIKGLADNNLETLKNTLKSVTGGKDIDLDVKIDPTIIGGLIVKVGSRMVDSSLRTKLNSIKIAMKEAR
jgi:F-type H+-transporting ATPase subunit delta